ncbi:ATP synthase F1 subunit epsilon [Erysipelothrix urinaevulpis]|uniref:ATP synthase F1 subunit epsilon n=1 Tax=Erysipelothrix urinaevulpis TaxID=2683717 RepID=UPI00135C8F54|nr:ATP synthase F1 subunit epsilon [Erysipelothrix urinaevulpis]
MFNLRIVSPEGVYSELEIDSITLPTIDGQRTMLSNHMATVLPLTIGIMYYKVKGETTKFFLSEGLFTFENNEGLLLVNAVESQTDIDFNRAEKAKQRAEERLKEKQDSVDMRRAELALQRSLARLKLRQ